MREGQTQRGRTEVKLRKHKHLKESEGKRRMEGGSGGRGYRTKDVEGKKRGKRMKEEKDEGSLDGWKGWTKLRTREKGRG